MRTYPNKHTKQPKHHHPTATFANRTWHQIKADTLKTCGPSHSPPRDYDVETPFPNRPGWSIWWKFLFVGLIILSPAIASFIYHCITT